MSQKLSRFTDSYSPDDFSHLIRMMSTFASTKQAQLASQHPDAVAYGMLFSLVMLEKIHSNDKRPFDKLDIGDLMSLVCRMSVYTEIAKTHSEFLPSKHNPEQREHALALEAAQEMTLEVQKGYREDQQENRDEPSLVQSFKLCMGHTPTENKMREVLQGALKAAQDKLREELQAHLDTAVANPETGETWTLDDLLKEDAENLGPIEFLKHEDIKPEDIKHEDFQGFINPDDDILEAMDEGRELTPEQIARITKNPDTHSSSSDDGFVEFLSERDMTHEEFSQLEDPAKNLLTVEFLAAQAYEATGESVFNISMCGESGLYERSYEVKLDENGTSINEYASKPVEHHIPRPSKKRDGDSDTDPSTNIRLN